MNGNKPIEQIIENAAASVEMEGYIIDSTARKAFIKKNTATER